VLARSLVDDPRVFGLAWPLFGATAALSTLLAARWMRRAARLRVWAVSQLAMGVGVLLPTVWVHGAGIALAAVLVGGTFMVITMAGVQEIRARAPADATRQVGRMTAAFAIGQIAGPVLSALLVRWLGGSGLNVAQQAGAATLLLSGCWLWHIASLSTAPETTKEISHARH
jgi:MFS family permease